MRSIRFAVISALVVIVAGGCGIPTDRTDRPLPRAQVPFEPLPPSTSTTTTTPATTTTLPVPTTTPPPTTTSTPSTTTTTTPAPAFPENLYFLRSDELVRVRRFVGAEPRLTDIVNAFVIGPTSDEISSGIRTALSLSSMITGVTREGFTALVDLDASFLDLPGTEQIRAIGQIVYTVTGVGGGIGNVRFTFNGRRGAVPRADGRPVSKPVSRDDYASLLSIAGDDPVATVTTIADPTLASTVGSTVDTPGGSDAPRP